MARQNIKITVESFIRIGDRLISTDDLNNEQKAFLGAMLKAQYLNGLFAGRAVFMPEGLKPFEEVFGELN